MSNQTYLTLLAKDLEPGMTLVNWGVVESADTAHVPTLGRKCTMVIFTRNTLLIGNTCVLGHDQLVVIKKPGS